MNILFAASEQLFFLYINTHALDTHLTNCRMRSETNLAVVTMNDPGSLNVWVLCSM